MSVWDALTSGTMWPLQVDTNSSWLEDINKPRDHLEKWKCSFIGEYMAWLFYWPYEELYCPLYKNTIGFSFSYFFLTEGLCVFPVIQIVMQLF